MVRSNVCGLETVSLGYFNVFGPRQDPTSPYSGVLSLFVTTLLDGKRPAIFGGGEQLRDFTFADNVVEANLLALLCSSRRRNDRPGPHGLPLVDSCHSLRRFPYRRCFTLERKRLARLRQPGRANQKVVGPGPGNPPTALQTAAVFSPLVAPRGCLVAVTAPEAHVSPRSASVRRHLRHRVLPLSRLIRLDRLLQEREHDGFLIGRGQQVKTSGLQHLDPFPLATRAAENDHRQVGISLFHLPQGVRPGAPVEGPSAEHGVEAAVLQMGFEFRQVPDATQHYVFAENRFQITRFRFITADE